MEKFFFGSLDINGRRKSSLKSFQRRRKWRKVFLRCRGCFGCKWLSGAGDLYVASAVEVKLPARINVHNLSAFSALS